MIAALLVATLSGLLAYANGANDISKGIATLVGSGVTSYRRALLWGTAWTALGAALAWALAGAILVTFGNGLLAAGVVPSLPAAVGALAGAAAWVFVATRSSLPVSTTHALVGGLIGAGVAAYGVAGIAWSSIGARVAVPLAVSPVVAVLLARLVVQGLTRVFGAPHDAADCVCVTADVVPRAQWVAPGSAAPLAGSGVALSVMQADAAMCRDAHPSALRMTGNHLHWLSGGAVSFARGLNDAPKMVALAVAAIALAPGEWSLSTPWLFALVTAGIMTGSLVAGRRVTRVLAEDVTRLDHRDGLAANLVTAALVTAGAVYGLPMSTTHVSSGGIMGVGAERGALNWRTVRGIVLAWIVTLPAAALFGVLAYEMARAWLR